MLKQPKLKRIKDSFESNSLSDIWSDKRLESSSLKYQSKRVRKGKKALEITVHKGDKEMIGGSGQSTERDEVLERHDLRSLENKEYIYSFSIYLPKSFPIVPTRLVIAQWKQTDVYKKATVNNPVIAIRYNKARLRITLQTTKEKTALFETNEEIRGKWIDYKFHIRFSRKKNGILKVWMNKKQVINYKGITAYPESLGYPSPGIFFFKMGLYRDTMTRPMTAFFDEYEKRWI